MFSQFQALNKYADQLQNTIVNLSQEIHLDKDKQDRDMEYKELRKIIQDSLEQEKQYKEKIKQLQNQIQNQQSKSEIIIQENQNQQDQVNYSQGQFHLCIDPWIHLIQNKFESQLKSQLKIEFALEYIEDEQSMMDDLFNSTSLNYDKSYDEVKQHIISEISQYVQQKIQQQELLYKQRQNCLQQQLFQSQQQNNEFQNQIQEQIVKTQENQYFKQDKLKEQSNKSDEEKQLIEFKTDNDAIKELEYDLKQMSKQLNDQQEIQQKYEETLYLIKNMIGVKFREFQLQFNLIDFNEQLKIFEKQRDILDKDQLVLMIQNLLNAFMVQIFDFSEMVKEKEIQYVLKMQKAAKNQEQELNQCKDQISQLKKEISYFQEKSNEIEDILKKKNSDLTIKECQLKIQISKVKEQDQSINDQMQLIQQLNEDIEHLNQQKKEKEGSSLTQDVFTAKQNEFIEILQIYKLQISDKEHEIIRQNVQQENLNEKIQNLETQIESLSQINQENEERNQLIIQQYNQEIKSLLNILQDQQNSNENNLQLQIQNEKQQEKIIFLNKQNQILVDQKIELENKIQQLRIYQREQDKQLDEMIQDKQNYCDKALYAQFLIKYFDPNQTYQVKMQTLETLSNMLSLDDIQRVQIGLPKIYSQQQNNLQKYQQISPEKLNIHVADKIEDKLMAFLTLDYDSDE